VAIRSEASLAKIGMQGNVACLQPEAGLPLRTADYNVIDVDQLTLQATYVYRTGETLFDMAAAVADFAVIDMSAANTILPRRDAMGQPSDPALRVSRAVLSVPASCVRKLPAVSRRAARR